MGKFTKVFYCKDNIFIVFDLGLYSILLNWCLKEQSILDFNILDGLMGYHHCPSYAQSLKIAKTLFGD